MFYISVNGQQIYKPLDDLLVLFNPKVTLEIGKAGSLEFDIPPNNPFYDKLDQLTTEVSVDMDSDEIFHGRVLSVERTFNNLRHVYCEGDLSYLIDSVQKSVQYSGTTHDLFNRIIASHNARVDANKQFTVGIVNIENREIVLVGQSQNNNINSGAIDYKQIAIDSIVGNWNNSFDYIQTCLIDYCGGYLRTRRVNGVTYIDLLEDFNSEAVQPIELGRNLLDLTQEISVEDLFTVLIPLGDDNLTIESVNGGSDELVDEEAVRRYGRIVRTHTFNNVSNASTLLENARRYMATSINIPRTVSVRAVDLHLINKTIPYIKIGDKVEITSYVHEVNDVLTCTKIEYDLERPENNNYTFGNPKQTLTQRYREDIRHDSDIYGNSAINPTAAQSIGQASAASAGAIGAAAAQSQEEALSAFYDAWIDFDRTQATVSLGALSKAFYDGKEVLKSQCGIDLDGTTGNINIHSLHNQIDDYGRTLATNTARIEAIQTDTSVAIQSVTERVDSIGSREATHYTEITQQTDQLGSSITSLARDINEFEGGVTTALASITQRADDQEARITATATYVSQVEGETNTKIANITAWANSAESVIEMKADRIYVDGKFEAAVATIDDLTAGRTTAARIRATDIMAGSISLFAEGGAVPVASMNHSHNFTFLEQTNGDIVLSLGGGTTTIPQQASFNIANTKFYKDNVAAKTIKSLDLNTEAPYTDGLGYRYETANKRYLVYIKATMSDSDEDIVTGGPLYVNARTVVDAAMDAGAQSAVVETVTAEPASTPTWNAQDEIWISNVRVHGTARSTLADGAPYRDSSYNTLIPINVTTVYNAGKEEGGSAADDVYVQTLGFNPDEDPWYSSTVNNFYIPIKAVPSTGLHPKTTTLTLSAQPALNDVTVTGLAYYTQSGEQTISYDSSSQTLTAMVNATLNHNIPNVVRNVTIPADLAVTAGANSVRVNTMSFYTQSGEQTITYNAQTQTLNAMVRALLTNGQPFVRTVAIPADLAVTAGINSVTCTVAMTATQGSVSNAALIRANATLSSGVNPASNSATVRLSLSQNSSTKVVTANILNADDVVIASSTLTPAATEKAIRTVDITRNGSQDWYDGGGYWALPIRVVIQYKDGTSSQRYVAGVNIMDVVNAASGGGGGSSGTAYSFYCTSRSESGGGRITVDLSISSYSNLPFYQGGTYTLYYG